jgi:hypothetical protein
LTVLIMSMQASVGFPEFMIALTDVQVLPWIFSLFSLHRETYKTS